MSSADPPIAAGERRPLPRLLLIADGFATGRAGMTAEEVRLRVVGVVEAGAMWVSLRDHRAPAPTFEAEAMRFAARLREARADVRLSVHGSLATAAALGSGLHVGWRGASLRTAREAHVPGYVGVSAHTIDEVRRAARDGADYVTLSPVFPTATHPDAVPVGLVAVEEAAREGCPILGLGGVTPDRVRAVLDAGAHGVAVLSGLLDAPRPASALQAYLDALPAPIS